MRNSERTVDKEETLDVFDGQKVYTSQSLQEPTLNTRRVKGRDC